MRIGYFCTEFPYKNPINDEVLSSHPYGGVENGTYQLAKQMAKKGHDVYIFTSSIKNNDTYEEYGNIHIYRYRKIFSIGQAPISIGLLHKPIILKLKLDIVHARMGNLPAPLFGCFYSRLNGIPCVVSYHGDWDGSFGSFSRRLGVFLFNHFLSGYILSGADRIVALSVEQALESKILQKYSHNLTFIPNGLNLEEFDVLFSKEQCRKNLGLPENAKIILFLGSLIPIKGPDVLVKSMRIILDTIPDSYLVIVGDGPMKQELKKLAHDLGIGASVYFSGFAFDDKIQYYRAADVFVLPSRNEAFGNVLLEASASGLPMVVSDVGGVKAIVHQDANGVFAKVGDAMDFAKKIIYLLKNDEVRVRMGQNARNNCEAFTWTSVATETERLYVNIITK